MKKIIMFVLSLFMMSSLYCPVFANDHYIHKNYSVIVQANPKDPRDLIKITAQYLCNEAKGFCECLSVAYEIISLSPTVALDIRVSEQNLKSGIGGAIAKIKVNSISSSFYGTSISTRKNFLISMKFMPNGTASHAIKVL